MDVDPSIIFGYGVDFGINSIQPFLTIGRL